MTAWEIIKKKMTINTNVGTFGYNIAVKHAASIFVDILPYLKDENRESEAFNKDTEIPHAIGCGMFENELKKAGIL